MKWFNPTKGYGFIQPQGGGGKDVFVHISAVERAAINEWLRRRGVFALPIVDRQRSLRRWVRDNVVIALSVAFGIGLLIGLFLQAP